MKVMAFYFVIVFLFSSLYSTSQFNQYGSIAIALSLLLIIPIYLIYQKKNLRVNSIVTIIVYLLSLTVLLSTLINSDVSALITNAVFIFLFITSLIILPHFKGVDINKTVFKAIIISHIPIVFLPLLLNGFDTVPYRGIFYNPNSFGTIVVTIFAALFAYFLFRLEGFISGQKASKFKLWMMFGVLFLTALLVVLSRSRTSVIAMVAITAIGLFFLTVRLVKMNKIGSVVAKGAVLGSIFSFGTYLLFKLTDIYYYLYINFLYKFEVKLNEGDLFASRTGVWSTTIKDSTLLGNGSNYFDDSIGLGAHNTFIQILGESGWVFLITFILFLVYCLFKTLKYCLSNTTDKYKYLPLMMIITFSILSMGESMMFKLSMMAMFFSLGSVFKLKKESVVEKKTAKKIKRRLVW